MKKFAIVYCMILMWQPILASAVLVQDDFESYSIGSWPTGWIKDGNAQNDPANNRIVADPTDSSNKVLKLFGMLNASWAGIAYAPVSYPSEFTIQFRVYNGSENLTGAHPDRATLWMIQGTNWWNPGHGFLYLTGTGEIYGYGTENSSMIGTYQTERWYDMKILYRRQGTNLLTKYWIDGLEVAQFNDTISDLPKELSFDHLAFAAQEGTVYFDNVLITPEPGTVLLLGLGGMVLRKRVKK